jgi:hypothetical protein
MNESTHALPASQLRAVAMANTLSPDQRWAQWRDQGARHDARVGRNMRLIVALALTIGSVWALLVL